MKRTPSTGSRVGVAHSRDADRQQHVAAGDFDALVDGNGLRAVDLLDSVDQIALQFVDTEKGENVVRVDRALLAAASIAIGGSPARTRSPSWMLTWTERGTEYSWRVPSSVSMMMRRMPLTTGP